MAEMERKVKGAPRDLARPQSLGDVLRSQKEEKAEVEEEHLQILTFKVGTEEYALNIMDVKEIIRPKPPTEIPRTPPYVLGILSLRGIIIPVFDMRLRLGLPSAESSRTTRIVVVKEKENLFGLLVDAVVQVMNLSLSQIEPPPEIIGGVEGEFLLGVGKVGERLVILLNLPRVLLIEETLRLGAEGTPLPALSGAEG